MLWTILVVLLVLWALGFGFAGAAVGNLIHILLVVALVVLILQLVTGRRGAV
ncbi:MAG: lmo0937 family membrane protein [Pyrinomonadaceae bacterium]